MANQRISELVQILASELSSTDLLILSDVSEVTSKRLELGDLYSYFDSMSNSGSFLGTASWSDSASFALTYPTPSTSSYSNTSSWAFNAISSSYTDNAGSSSYSISSSNSLTASYALTTSVQVINSSSFSTFSNTASYLYYNPYVPNGTASYSLTSSLNSGTSSFSLTASYALYTNITSPDTSSALYALSSSWASASYQSISASRSISASYLIYREGLNNGTASYALNAGGYPSYLIDYGIFKAFTQSMYNAHLDKIDIIADEPKSSSFESMGTVFIPHTDVTTETSSLELVLLNRWSGITSSIDSSPLSLLLPTSGAGSSITVPFSLMGEVVTTGSYLLYVTSSGTPLAQLVPSRIVRFRLSSYSTNVTANSAETMSFTVRTISDVSPIMSFTSSAHGLQSGTDVQIVASGSSDITALNTSNQSVEYIKYLWTLDNLEYLNASSNYVMTDLGGVPNSLITMSVQECSLYSLAPLTYTSVGYLDCSYNQLRSLSNLPATMSYLNCSNNSNLSSIPNSLPANLQILDISNIIITQPPNYMPDTIISMSAQQNSSLALWTTSLPTSLEYLDIYSTSITSLPTMPSNVIHVNVSASSMTGLAMDNLADQLDTNGLSNGYLNIIGNESYLTSTAAKTASLISKGWTVVS